MKTAPSRLLPLLLGLGIIAGCYSTRIGNGLTPSSGSPTANDTWHHNFIGGLAEGSSALDLDAACPGGRWAQIEESFSFVNGLVALVTGGIYTPRTYTVLCAAASADVGPARGDTSVTGRETLALSRSP